jgi:hypothetical protein
MSKQRGSHGFLSNLKIVNHNGPTEEASTMRGLAATSQKYPMNISPLSGLA